MGTSEPSVAFLEAAMTISMRWNPCHCKQPPWIFWTRRWVWVSIKPCSVEDGMDLQKSKREGATGQSNNSSCILFLGSLAPCILTLAIFFSTKNHHRYSYMRMLQIMHKSYMWMLKSCTQKPLWTHELLYEGLQQAALQTGLHKRFITLWFATQGENFLQENLWQCFIPTTSSQTSSKGLAELPCSIYAWKFQKYNKSPNETDGNPKPKFLLSQFPVQFPNFICTNLSSGNAESYIVNQGLQESSKSLQSGFPMFAKQ
jgi:hypothetical protein